MSNNYKISLPNEASMISFGHEIAKVTQGVGVLFLLGDLGMGKTTLSRGVLQGMGHQGSVKSPTYTLVEPYEVDDKRIYHFDLYRLSDPEELEYLGIRDYFDEQALCLVEWPSKGAGMLPKADMLLNITLQGYGRELCWVPQTEKGQLMADRLVEALS